MAQYILAIDQGTTTTRAFLFNDKAQTVYKAAKTFNQYFPKSGWVEHDPEEIWQRVLMVCKNVISKIDHVSSIKAIGITNQRETTVVWDKKTGGVIYPAIVWQDRRTASWCDEFRDKLESCSISHKTGLLIDAYFSATKISWILNHVTGARERAENGELAFGTIDSFLIWRLTKGQRHVTDVTNASRTLLFNIHTQQWDDELLAAFQVPKAMLPHVLNNCDDFGVCDKSFFGSEIPIAGVAGDQQASAFGQGCFEPEMTKVTYGTGGFLLVNTGDKIVSSRNRFLTTILSRIGDRTQYAMEGSIFVAGAAIKWLREKMGVLTTAAESEKLAMSLDSNEGVYMVPSFTGLGAPYWKANVRGGIFGLTRGTSKAHLVRAALEAICYQTKDLVDAMREDGVNLHGQLRVDGGLANNHWFLSYLADCTQFEVCKSANADTTVLGVALLAGLHVGFFDSIQQLKQFWHSDYQVQAKADAKHIDDAYKKWQLAVKATLLFQ